MAKEERPVANIMCMHMYNYMQDKMLELALTATVSHAGNLARITSTSGGNR